jgi:hypothetical protein
VFDWDTLGITKTYLKFDDTDPWPLIRYWRDQSWVETDNVTFTTQQLRINPNSVLSNHGGTRENIIYIDAAGTTNDKQYEIGGGDITQLNGDLDTIALPNNTFVNGIEYDIRPTIYDSAGNEYSPTGDSYISNITYDDVPPEIVIGYGGPLPVDIVKKVDGVSFKHDTTKTSGPVDFRIWAQIGSELVPEVFVVSCLKLTPSTFLTISTGSGPPYPITISGGTSS